MRHPKRLSWLTIVAAVTTVCGLALVLPPADAVRAAGSLNSSDPGRGAAAAGVVIDDIVIDVAHGPGVEAYVVRPAGHLAPKSQAGVLFLHWLGQLHNDRTEYLGEAVTLAGQGVVSVLPQGTFPWN